MTRVTLDADSATRLYDISQTVELCDPSGRVLGRFVPVADMSEWEPMIPDVTEDELDRRDTVERKALFHGGGAFPPGEAVMFRWQ